MLKGCCTPFEEDLVVKSSTSRRKMEMEGSAEEKRRGYVFLGEKRQLEKKKTKDRTVASRLKRNFRGATKCDRGVWKW